MNIVSKWGDETTAGKTYRLYLVEGVPTLASTTDGTDSTLTTRSGPIMRRM